jgi:CheY-like chemotaxis protein
MEKAKIIIVDDDADYINVVKTILEEEQYTVVTAGDKTEGMEKIRTEQPDLIILDVMMNAWQDGFAMSRQLKKDPQLKNIPILMLTVIGEKTGIDFKSTSGDPIWIPVDVFLNKPVEPQVLLTEVKKLLSNKVENEIRTGKHKV